MSATAAASAAPASTRPVPSLPTDHLLGHMPEMGRDPLGLISRAHAEMGDIVHMRMAHRSIISIARPEYVRHVLVTEATKYQKRTRGYRKLRLLLGNGLVTSEGDFWLRQRRIAQPAFHKKRIASFGEGMVRAADDLASHWATIADTRQVVDIAEEMMHVTLRIVGETLFSIDISDESDEIGRSVSTVLARFLGLVNAPYPWPEYVPRPANAKMWAARRTLHRVVDGLIADRRQSGEEVGDLLGMLMAARDEETGEGMSDEQLRDEALTMLAAGHETTANALTWTLYLLSKYPEVARKLGAELDEVLGDRLPTMADLRRLTYTSQVFHESMRLFPPVWSLARMPVEDDVIDGFHIPKDSYVFVSQWALHRHPGLWKNPEGFDPDRWAPGQPAPDRFAYFPFSRGRRQCIGDRFAEMEAVLLLAVFCKRFEFALVPGHPVVTQASVTLRPKHGLKMTLASR